MNTVMSRSLVEQLPKTRLVDSSRALWAARMVKSARN